MFKINNKPLLKRLAKQHLRFDKQNNFFVSLTIIISVAMIFSTLIIMQNKSEVHKEKQKDKAQVVLVGLTDNQVNEIRDLPEFEWVGLETSIATIKDNDVIYNVFWENENKLEKQESINLSGTIPKKDNELMMSKDLANFYQLKKGDTFSHDFFNTGKNQEYIVSGIVESPNEGYTLWLNENLARRLYSDDIFTSSGYVRMNTNAISSNKLLAFANDAIKETSISPDQIMLTEYFAVMTGNDREGYLMYYILSSITIIILASIIIYSIYYNSIIKSIQMFGQLKTIGLTSKQIKKILRMETNYLSFVTITIGLCIGFVIAIIVQFEGLNLFNTLSYALIVVLVVYCCIRISIRKPLKIASKISPIEARYFEESIGKIKSHQSHRITSWYFAWRNFLRHKKTTFFSIFVLSLSITCLIATSMLRVSVDPEKKAKFNYFPDGQIQLSINEDFANRDFKETKQNGYSSSEIQIKENPLTNSDLLNQIKEIEGVIAVTSHDAVFLKYEVPAGLVITTLFHDAVPTVNQETYEKLKKISDGNFSYSDFTGGGILASEKSAKIGDMITLSGEKAEDQTFNEKLPVIGTYSTNDLMSKLPIVPGTPDIIISEEYIKKNANISNQTGVLSINVKDDLLDSAEKSLRELTQKNDDLSISFQSQVTENIQNRYNDLLSLMFVISLILLVFGFLSLINIRISSLILRKKELSIYKSLGMTNKQLTKILDIENFIFLILIIGIGSLVGNIIGLVICYIVNQSAHIISLSYPFKMQIIILLIGLLVAISFHFVIKRNLKKY